MEGESPEQWGLEVEGGWAHTEWQDYNHSPAISTQWVPPARAEPHVGGMHLVRRCLVSKPERERFKYCGLGPSAAPSSTACVPKIGMCDQRLSK